MVRTEYRGFPKFAAEAARPAEKSGVIGLSSVERLTGAGLGIAIYADVLSEVIPLSPSWMRAKSPGIGY